MFDRRTLAVIYLLAVCHSWLAIGFAAGQQPEAKTQRPHVILVMADDMGWAQTGYRNHPLLKTPHLDAMATAGLRFERFYAGAPNCSPTRATVLTGRTNDRTGVENHGFGMQPHELTLATALAEAGYATGHFGKWHLNGLRGPGVPIFADDPLNPGKFGFQSWLSATNFFDRDPLLSRQGGFEAFEGDSSEIIVDEALQFLRQHAADQPCLAVVWYGSPHSPWAATAEDREAFPESMTPQSKHHYGELVAMDRSIGTLRAGLREMGIAENTLLWFCSDNGGLPQPQPSTVGPLRGFKGKMFEGGLRVPGIIEWPAVIDQPRVTEYPACTVDIFPTLVDALQLPKTVMLQPQDGISLLPLMRAEIGLREKPLGFRHTGRTAWIDNDWKIVSAEVGKRRFALYNLAQDEGETTDVSQQHPQRFQQMVDQLTEWSDTVDASAAGQDYAVDVFDRADSQPRVWSEEAAYQPYLSEWQKRPELAGWLRRN